MQDKQESKEKGNSNFNKKLLGIENDGAIILHYAGNLRLFCRR